MLSERQIGYVTKAAALVPAAAQPAFRQQVATMLGYGQHPLHDRTVLDVLRIVLAQHCPLDLRSVVKTAARVCAARKETSPCRNDEYGTLTLNGVEVSEQIVTRNGILQSGYALRVPLMLRDLHFSDGARCFLGSAPRQFVGRRCSPHRRR